jgi:hypothetical protein
MRPLRRLSRSPLAASVLASASVFLGLMGLRRSGSLAALELAAYDWHIRFRPGAAVSDPRLVLKQTDRVGFSDILDDQTIQLFLERRMDGPIHPGVQCVRLADYGMWLSRVCHIGGLWHWSSIPRTDRETSSPVGPSNALRPQRRSVQNWLVQTRHKRPRSMLRQAYGPTR